MYVLNLVIILLSIILQFIAAIWVISIIRVSGQRLAWILVALALILMTVRRIEALTSMGVVSPLAGMNLFDVTGFIISALMLVGTAYVRQYFVDIRTAERAVRESEHQYRILAQNIPNAAILLFDRDLRFIVVEGSIRVPEIYSKESLEGKTIWEVFPTQFAERVAPLAQKALAGEAVTDELDLLGRVFSLQLFPIRDEQGQVVQGMGMGMDITERLKAEQDRQHAYEFLQTTIDGVAEPVMVIGIDYQVMLMNSAVRNEYVGEQAVVPQTCYALSHQRDTPCDSLTHPCPLVQVRQTLLPVTIEHKHETANGETRDIEILASPLFDARGQLTGIVEASRDITERKQAELALERRAVELEVLASVSAAMRIAHNRAEIPPVVLGAILDLLKALGAAMVAEDEHSGNILVEAAVGDWSSWQGVCFPADQFHELLAPLLDQPYLNNRATELIQRLVPDVPVPTLALAGAPLIADRRRIGNLWFGRPGEISETELRLLTAISDIVANALQRSALHENLEAQYETLQKTQSRLVQSEKLAAIGELVAGVAHELNNPLTAVVLYAQMLQDQSASQKTNTDMEQIIVSEAQRASKIVRGLLEFARQRPPERKPVQINNLLQSSLELLAYEQHTNNIRIETHYTPDLPVTLADPHQLQQVFVNIIANAWQAIPENDQGLLNLSTQVGPSIFGPRQPRDSDVIRIQFQDNGPGISPEHMPHIFNPFFTTKQPGQGTGLGLSICHGIVTEHGGHIWAESGSLQGATFVIELPVVIPETLSESQSLPPDSPSIQSAAPRETSTKRILLIDDEKNILTVIKRALQRNGYQVDAANSAAAGLEMLKKVTYDLILCDIRMPEMSGTEFYQVVELRYPELTQRVIFSTGDSVSYGTRQFLDEVGAICLTKPFELSELLARVREVLQG